jgi:hypothetical protein
MALSAFALSLSGLRANAVSTLVVEQGVRFFTIVPYALERNAILALVMLRNPASCSLSNLRPPWWTTLTLLRLSNAQPNMFVRQ